MLDNAPTYLTFLEAEVGRLDSGQLDAAQKALAEMARSKTLRPPPDLEEPVKAAIDKLVEYHPDEVRAGAIKRDQVAVAFLLSDPRLRLYIIAISLGSVFFGACTYIGNGPNFMVKLIADAAGAHAPSFMGYIARYTLPVLLPVYVLVWWLFLR